MTETDEAKSKAAKPVIQMKDAWYNLMLLEELDACILKYWRKVL